MKSLLRPLWIVLTLLFTTINAEELPGTNTAVIPGRTVDFLPSFLSNKSFFSLAAGVENWATGGMTDDGVKQAVELDYQRIHISCETLRYWQTAVVGVQRLVPERALLLSGPNGVDPVRVVLDSRASTMPQIAFRGIMKPAEVELTREPADAKEPLVVRFKLVLKKAGDFSGLMKTDTGLQPYAGWAETIVARIRADIDAQRQVLVNQRMESLDFYSRPPQDGKPREKTIIRRLKVPLAEDAPAKSVPITGCTSGLNANLISIFFDDQGKVDHMIPSAGEFITEDIDLFGSAPTQKPSAPVVLPTREAASAT